MVFSLGIQNENWITLSLFPHESTFWKWMVVFFSDYLMISNCLVGNLKLKLKCTSFMKYHDWYGIINRTMNKLLTTKVTNVSLTYEWLRRIFYALGTSGPTIHYNKRSHKSNAWYIDIDMMSCS